MRIPRTLKTLKRVIHEGMIEKHIGITPERSFPKTGHSLQYLILNGMTDPEMNCKTCCKLYYTFLSFLTQKALIFS